MQGKVCSLVFDRGSYANVVSLSMIEKLGLQTVTHPHPYNIHWLNQSKGIEVNSRRLITFSIGENYQDELWCDMIPMDACHMLFGRMTEGLCIMVNLILIHFPKMARRSL